MIGKIAYEAIEKNRPIIKDLADKIWKNPEGPYKEFNACQWTAQVLRDAGFDVEVGVAGVPTAIKATYGSGHPVIGFLGEYDSLPGLNQKVCTHQELDSNCGYGHGCGHNLLGSAHVAGVLGMKKEMEETGLAGTIVFYGCPAEEVLTGKPFMARGGAFDCLDLCIAFHPDSVNAVYTGTAVGINSVKFHYHGKTAHAGGAPQNGRSALDALELTNVGVQYLREHVTNDIRIHYFIEDGGMAPNIVPDYARSWYMVRSLTREGVDDVYARLIKVAKGAAMMTETEVEVEFLGGCYPTQQNHALAKVLEDCMAEIPWETFTEEEKQFAKEIDEANPISYNRMVNSGFIQEGQHLFEGIAPTISGNSYGSYDVGDVEYIVPGIMFFTTCKSVAAQNHHWQTTACVGSSIGEKGMTNAAKVMALFGLKVLQDPSIYQAAKAEFDKTMNGRTYQCPIPADVKIPE